VIFKGTITFRAPIKGNGLQFTRVEFNPQEPGVEKVQLQGQDGREIRGTIYLASVESKEVGKNIVKKVLAATFGRLSFNHNIAIENAYIIESQFAPLHPHPGASITPDTGDLDVTGEKAILAFRYPAETIKAELEQSSPHGARYFGLFRSARLSESPVEEFIHLYNLLLMFLGEDQKAVDVFILREAPGTPLTPSGNPKAKVGELETIYTRLRNELGHHREGVNLDDTKAEMANRVGELAALTKRAIELRPEILREGGST